MHRFQHLTVALNRTAADAGLLDYAAMVVRLGTALQVRFLHVLTDAESAEKDEVVAESLRAAAMGRLGDGKTQPAFEFDVLRGPLLDSLLTHATRHNTDLLLIGHRGDVPARCALARRLAMKAPCSVWLVPEGSPPTLERILVPVDFSEPSADALQVATEMAKAADHGECLALHVYFNEAHATYEAYEQVLRGQEREAFEEFVEPLDLHGIRVTPLFEEGVRIADVVNRIADSRKCDLVMMATRGRSRSAAILLGSVTEQAIEHTRRPLLVVKHYGRQIGLVRALVEKTFRGKGPQFD
jgi:nucleotide-binding universal stress UspA family protein